MLPALLIVLCVVLRGVPYPPNFAPVGATAAFAGRVAAAMFAGEVILARLHGYPASARLESRPVWVPVPTNVLEVA